MYSIELIIILSKRRVFVTIIDLLFYVNQIVSIQIKLQLLLMGVNPSSYTEPKRLNLRINRAVHCSPDRNCVQHKGRKSGDFYRFTSFWENTFQTYSLSFTDCRRAWRRSCFDMRPQITWYCLVVSVGPLEKTRYVSFLHPGLTAVLSLSYFSIHGSNYLVSFFSGQQMNTYTPNNFFSPSSEVRSCHYDCAAYPASLPVLSDCDLSHCLWTDNRNVCVAVAGSAEAGRSHQVKDIIPDI